MPEFLSLLRGINVGGQKMIKMPELVKIYQEVGCSNISTYIQSGNVVFDHDYPENIEYKIRQNIAGKFHFDVPILLRTKNEISKLIDSNPFLSNKQLDITALYVTFLSGKPDLQYLDKIADFNSGADKMICSNKEVYLYCPMGYGQTKLNLKFFENKLKLTATARNWRTILELKRMMD